MNQKKKPAPGLSWDDGLGGNIKYFSKGSYDPRKLTSERQRPADRRD